ncbi:hypothetical protein [Dipodfec virus UA04Rod_2041]|uniref:Uncharacterized protein n=1 Tax=Dipodfec virus UA04Rod_2041 TaxID=2929249 RepID=A0A976N1E6_9VIRU|nr:hypothetical protein [Dipodfec virus UA04Rod_2041]
MVTSFMEDDWFSYFLEYNEDDDIYQSIDPESFVESIYNEQFEEPPEDGDGIFNTTGPLPEEIKPRILKVREKIPDIPIYKPLGNDSITVVSNAVGLKDAMYDSSVRDGLIVLHTKDVRLIARSMKNYRFGAKAILLNMDQVSKDNMLGQFLEICKLNLE